MGITAATIAVATRAVLPLAPQQLPTITLVITLAVVTTFVGARAGVTTALIGGLLSWYLFFNPHSWSLANQAWIPFVGFTIIATVIIATASLYRTTERRLHSREMAELEQQAANAELFAREMAHRLKNALTIVQAIAFQTLGTGTEATTEFAGRLKVLADANELLSEHVSKPVAQVGDVIEAALSPFDGRRRIEIEAVPAEIPAQQVVSLALALHELATNAVKYGSLSQPRGRVLLTVDDADDRLALNWKELGGPAVSAPERSGFGTKLLRRSGMGTKLEFEPDGLSCSFGIRKR